MLTPVPHLTLPTATVRASYLQGETELAIEEGVPTSWIKDAAADFGSFVSRRRVVRELWAVPATELWFVDGSDYIGTVIIRHRLTPALAREGGHIGFHVVPRYRRRGHATQMLAQAKPACHALGLTNLLITCDQDNIGSRRVIEANSGVLEGIVDGLARYWLPTGPTTPEATAVPIRLELAATEQPAAPRRPKRIPSSAVQGPVATSDCNPAIPPQRSETPSKVV